jgi:hypothetical protein
MQNKSISNKIFRLDSKQKAEQQSIKCAINIALSETRLDLFYSYTIEEAS